MSAYVEAPSPTQLPLSARPKVKSWNYETIKREAKERGTRVTDMIALAPQNDPFYVGTPGDVEIAEWFAGIWHQFGFTEGVHLRRVHYQIVSQETPLLLPNGTPYENTEKCWDALGMAAKAARYLGRVHPAAFVDRRNPEPLIYMPDAIEAPWLYITNYLDDESAELPPFPDLPDSTLGSFDVEQPYHVEIWCEKSTQNDVLKPLCEEYGVNLVTGLGELSITATFLVVQRILTRGKPTRIFYVSDFDPAGLTMPVSVARKIEFFIRNEASGGVDIRLFPLILSAEQVKQYKLPRTPIKETEKRRDTFEHRHGTGAVELDALEALRPGELAAVLSDAIERYFDVDLAQRARAVRSAYLGRLADIRQAIIARHDDEIAQVRAEYEEISDEFQSRFAGCHARMAELWERIESELSAEAERPDVKLLPQAKPAREINDGLFNSQRNYLTQLEAYKTFQGKAVTA